jgi:hypothetical protein
LHRLNDIYNLERVFLPLASDGTNVDVVLALTMYQSVHGTSAQKP